MKSSTIGIVLMSLIVGGIVIQTMYTEGTKVLAYEKEAEEPKVVLIEVHPTALNKIADCESGARLPNGKAVEGSATHFNEDGSVKLGAFTDPKYGQDVGEHQINTKYHERTAEAMGINIWTKSGNADYARHLYREEGNQPWSASKSCWKD